MSLSTLINFYIYVIITIITPGPNTIMSMKNGISYGFRRGIWFNFGHWAGFIIDMLACLIFSETLLDHLPAARPVMLGIGVLYMLYQAYKCLRMPAIAEGQDEAANLPSRASLVRQGLLLQFVNVKVLIFGMSAFSNYILKWNLTTGRTYSYCVILATVAFLCGVVWLIGGAAMRKLFTRYRRPVSIAMTAALVYCAVRLVI